MRIAPSLLIVVTTVLACGRNAGSVSALSAIEPRYSNGQLVFSDDNLGVRSQIFRPDGSVFFSNDRYSYSSGWATPNRMRWEVSVDPGRCYPEPCTGSFSGTGDFGRLNARWERGITGSTDTTFEELYASADPDHLPIAIMPKTAGEVDHFYYASGLLMASVKSRVFGYVDRAYYPDGKIAASDDKMFLPDGTQTQEIVLSQQIASSMELRLHLSPSYYRDHVGLGMTIVSSSAESAEGFTLKAASKYTRGGACISVSVLDSENRQLYARQVGSLSGDFLCE